MVGVVSIMGRGGSTVGVSGTIGVAIKEEAKILSSSTVPFPVGAELGSCCVVGLSVGF